MLNAAIDGYSRVLRRYRGSEEANAASERLLSLARVFEEQGRYHLAVSLFDKVEKLT